MKRICLQKCKIFICITAILLTFYFICFSAFAFSIDSAVAEETTIYTIDEDADSIIVVLDEDISAINKVHNKDFFEGVDIQSIVDLTARKRNFKSKNENFRQILQIFLKDNSTEAIIDAMGVLSRLDGIKSVEPNQAIKTEGLIDVASTTDTAPLLWGLFGENGININKSWAFTTGKEVRIGIIDTGIANHTFLNENLTTGWDFYNNNITTTDDTDGHGTHVAGTIGARNGGGEYMGVAYNVTLVPLQVANQNNKFFNKDIVSAIEWAEDYYGTEKQIDIINFSSSGFGETESIREAVRGYSGLFVWAAGNQGEDVDIRISEHGSFALSNLISVGAINEDGAKWSKSNYGANSVNIYAPGEGIFSTFLNNTYKSMSGTSMATPHVTGVAALLLSYNPDLTAEQLKNAIVNGSDTLSISIPDTTSESGTSTQSVKKLNATKALQYVMDRYCDKTTLTNYDQTVSKTVDASNCHFSKSNYMLSMNVANAYEYDFSVTSTSAMDVTLYDSSLNEVSISTTSSNGGRQIDFSTFLDLGTYYLQTSYVSQTTTGTISIDISNDAHAHSYTTARATGSTVNHRVYCACGAYRLEPHVVRIGQFDTTGTCAICGAFVPLSGNLTLNAARAQLVTANGSFIAPNGVVYLVDEDFDAYFNGTLVFYQRIDSSVVSKFGEIPLKELVA